MNKKWLSGLAAALVSLLTAWGVYKPAPNPVPTPNPTATVAPSVEPSPTAAPTSTPNKSECIKSIEISQCEFNPEEFGEFKRALIVAQEIAKDNGYLTPDGRVKDETLYTNEVARLLKVSGYCAINGRDGGHTSDDEVWIKLSNPFSEHYDIIRSDGYPIALFAARCVSAKF